MGTFESNIQTELHQLKSQLSKVRLTHKETSFKFKREQSVLKRLIASLSSACCSDNDALNHQLLRLKELIEQQPDVSTLIPRLAVIEHMLKQQTLTMEKQTTNLERHIRHGGETLLRIPGLPSKVKRDLRDLLNVSSVHTSPNSEQAVRLLSLYERSVKIIATNPNHSGQTIDHTAEKELQAQLSDELQTLITELDFEGESGDVLMDIRAKLLVGVSPHTLLELTLEVLRLVVEGTTHERKKSERFLEQVNTSLATHLKSSRQSIQQNQSYLSHRQEMNQELSKLMTKSNQVLKEQHDYAALKSGLSPLLAQLTSLSERLTHAEQREQALIERMEYTRNQMESLYESTQDYRCRLEDQAQRMLQDPLTKVYNRAAFHDRLELEYHRWIKTQHPLRVVLLDIDNFKVLNQSFGYSAGDKALKIIARTILKELSETDTVARFSGEEFMIIMPDRAEQESRLLVQNIQHHVENLPFKFKDKNLTITLSGASAAFQEGDTPDEVLEQVYRSLQEAKKAGPNQIIWKQ
ncbi:GGDEF domain-containing protein [Vibrio mangrovi]|uniref:diguanylate cyclase n=1 Tax=Vibrio mangrovi TaxID=474394 RepID=A0A1Y6IQC2_9VIBR|nr:GGDEF domain-containing protein [Vibrio mangrovi]MDW6003375.1 GGDEF domain-containing protein [Vibrio mangrovi]SMR99835.1 Response regulator PleD [Vibrio mangrovi]